MLNYTFQRDTQGWSAGFADYAVAQDPELLALTFSRRPLPEYLGGGMALYLSGRNVSDDLFMYLKREVRGLEPDRVYNVVFELQLASPAASGCTGVGGSPGESVYLKVGGGPIEPRTVISDGYFFLNQDKGNQSHGGEAAVVVGNIANGSTDCDSGRYRIIHRQNSMDAPLRVRASPAGSLWLLIGTDSGFEGTTSLYYTEVQVLLWPQ